MLLGHANEHLAKNSPLKQRPGVWSTTQLLYVLRICIDFYKLRKGLLLRDSAKITLRPGSGSQGFYNLTQVIGNKRPGQDCVPGDCSLGDRCIFTGLTNYSLSLEKAKSWFFSIQTLNFPSIQKFHCSFMHVTQVRILIIQPVVIS